MTLSLYCSQCGKPIACSYPCDETYCHCWPKFIMNTNCTISYTAEVVFQKPEVVPKAFQVGSPGTELEFAL